MWVCTVYKTVAPLGRKYDQWLAHSLINQINNSFVYFFLSLSLSLSLSLFLPPSDKTQELAEMGLV